MTVKNYSLPHPEDSGLYTELRLQENHKQVIQLVNGDVTANTVETVSGVSARVCKAGQWGFASRPEVNDETIETVLLPGNLTYH